MFIAPQTNVDIHVAEQLARALQPSIANINVKWNTSQRILHQAPKDTPPIFFGDRFLVYALLDETTPFDHTTTVELSTNIRQQPIGSARIDHIPAVLQSRAITRLAAKALLRELADVQKSTDKQSLIDISLTYGILCPHTAFIGVEKRLNVSSESNADMQLREVPLMIRNTSAQPYPVRAQMQMLRNSLPSDIIDNISDSLGFSHDTLCCVESHHSHPKRSTVKLARANSAFNPVGSIMRPVTSFFSSLFTKKRTATRNYPHCSPSIRTTSTGNHVDRSLSASSSTPSQISNTTWPSEEQKLVDRFIDLQQYDGLWTLTEDDIKQLTGKSLTAFSSSTVDNLQQTDQRSIISTVIVLVILEARCSSLKTLWQALSNKAKKRLQELLGGADQTKLEQLITDIRKQL